MQTSTRSLATTAALLLAVFPVAVVILNFLQAPSYSWRGNAMSELALGRGGALMFAAFTCMGVGTFLVAVLLHRELPQAKLGPAALIAAGLLDVTSAIFHTNRSGAPATTTSDIHLTAGITTFVLMVLAMFAMVRRFRRSERWSAFALPTLIWSVVAFATFFLIPILGAADFGLAQRLFVATWLSWLLTTALRARHVVSPRAFEVRSSPRSTLDAR
jgi:hypothetical membrane protein